MAFDTGRKRRSPRRMWLPGPVTAGSLVLGVAVVVFAINATSARHEAEQRRAQAENLIEFMLVELREHLGPLGKLGIVDAIGDHAMVYFVSLGKRGNDAEILSRAMALRQIGEVRFLVGREGAALDAFIASRDLTAAVQRARPDDTEILYQLARAQSWVGSVAWHGGDLSMARDAMQAYRDAAQQLVSRAPGNRDYEVELQRAAFKLDSIRQAKLEPDAEHDRLGEAANILNRYSGEAAVGVDL